jgi:uncharacterized protein
LSPHPKQQIIGVISDTHGLLRPEVLELFKGVSLILHAGDIGSPEVLHSLRTLAPVVAVRGNNDKDEWANEIPEVTIAHAGAISIYMLHDLKELNVAPTVTRFQALVCGHSHRSGIENRDGILFLNPGSAGPRRFKLPITVARMIIRGKTVHAEIIELKAA